MRDFNPNIPRIIHLGAEHGVTGSAHFFHANGSNIMVDCGMAQGRETVTPMEAWPLKPAELDYLFITHAHIDHIGRIPQLVQNGFKGEIISSHPTKILLKPMLEDAMSFSGLEDKVVQALMTTIDDLAWGFEFNQWFDLKKGLHFRLSRAGHILGSAFIHFESTDPQWSVLFSGDMGSREKPILPDPDPPSRCDLLILESTYGDTIHEERAKRIFKLGEIMSRALIDGGKVFIPSFALGRTQELIYEMDRLSSDPALRRMFPLLKPESGVPVFLDSPLGAEITRIYLRLAPYWDGEAKAILRSGDNPLDMAQLFAATKYEDHIKVLQMEGPAVIIAGSGMCTGGRIVEHLKAGIADPRNDIIFVGYQSDGTPGRDIIQYGNKPDGYVYLDGERYPINAKVHVLSGYSAHADQNDLIEWVQRMPEKPCVIKLVHGEPPARKALAQKLEHLGYNVVE